MTPGVIRKAMCLAGMALVMATYSIVASSEMKKETDMNARMAKEEGFAAVGIAVRTNNAEQITPERPIGKQWERLFREGVLAAIPNKANGNRRSASKASGSACTACGPPAAVHPRISERTRFGY